ncbi:uncharacterized protein UV8b_06668 [Ustilaginoidea virens]|uniref:RNA polymerase III transcription factor subunit n=1 Tax=Ustilaginoidea virens TaxID=1159556 RepID=A0A1B5L0T9_USTVR|nr:uncharacterized protein UV8b_06668 [Ustilaginoidea virens]QUC22427.1 hypothetical protein UV8b_06668 [Ustilaginoidea virens]GAO16963.1 hypothetical protein UVI_02044460 [Ustilaginoidea virens]
MEWSPEDESALPSNTGASEVGSRGEQGAPRFRIPARELTAVEIPAVVENLDRAVRAFGRVPTLAHVLDPTRTSIPIYLHPESPFCKPLMSHNAASHNVVLQVTVPRRTGRRRKRGTHGPWEGDIDDADMSTSSNAGQVRSVARLDEPKVLRRKLQDNVGKYQVDAVGVIKLTHRFRALADFYWDMKRSDFAQRYVEQVLPGDVEKLRQFAFEGGTDRAPNVDVIPPPIFTHMSLPFNYFYSQNPYVRTTEDGDTFNLTAVKQVGYFIGAEDPAPDGPQLPPDMADSRMLEVVEQLQDAFKIRPMWTRRSLMNHLQGKLQSWNELKKYLNYAAYQFKGGPWRDSVVPYGVDPRTDPRFRIYQTLMFKLKKHRRTIKDQTWQSVRKSQMGASNTMADKASDSHIFDGQTYSTDGKVWQVCDINDPLLRELLDNAAVRPECDVNNSGWYHGGLWAKVKAIMKTKLVGIQFGRQLGKEDFASTLECGDMTPVRTASNTLHLPLPDLNLTTEELTMLRGREPSKKKSRGYNVRFRDAGNGAAVAAEQSPAPFGGSSVVGADGVDSENDDSGSEGEDEEEEEEGGEEGMEADNNEAYEDDNLFDERGAEYAYRSYEDVADMDDGTAMSMGHVAYPELD